MPRQVGDNKTGQTHSLKVFMAKNNNKVVGTISSKRDLEFAALGDYPINGREGSRKGDASVEGGEGLSVEEIMVILNKEGNGKKKNPGRGVGKLAGCDVLGVVGDDLCPIEVGEFSRVQDQVSEEFSPLNLQAKSMEKARMVRQKEGKARGQNLVGKNFGLGPLYSNDESPNISISLGDVDTCVDANSDSNSGEETFQNNPSKLTKGGASKVFDKMPRRDERPKTSWVNLFKDNRRSGSGLQLSAYDVEGSSYTFNESQLKVPLGWEYGLVGYVAGKNPGKKCIIDCCKSWNVKYQIYFHENGWIVLKFGSEEDRRSVLEKGPYVIYDRPFILKIRPKLFCFDKDETFNDASGVAEWAVDV